MDKIDLILRQATKVLVTSHLQPDPDAICSALGMYDYILKEYQNLSVDIYLNGEKLEAYTALKNYDDIKWVNDIAEVVSNYDTIVFTDGSEITRFTTQNLNLSKYKTICIDHHKGSTLKADASILEEDQPSASQIIYSHFFKNTNLIEPYIAEVLLTGILSDTVMLKYTKHKPIETLDIVKDLIEISDMDISRIEEKYFGFTQYDWEIIQELTKNIVRVQANTPFIYSYLPVEFLNRYSLNVIKQGKSKFLQLFGTSLQGYPWSFIATPNSITSMNISFRSLTDSINVREIANNFNGGGHDNMSGGEISIQPSESAQEVCLKIVNKIKTII